MTESPDFYITAAGESRELLVDPRACWNRGRLRDASRDDYMLVEIAPTLIGQQFGLGRADVSQLILSTRHVGQTLFPVSEWPGYVYVARVLDEDVLRTHLITPDQVQVIAWATLFRSREEAENQVSRFR